MPDFSPRSSAGFAGVCSALCAITLVASASCSSAPAAGAAPAAAPAPVNAAPVAPPSAAPAAVAPPAEAPPPASAHLTTRSGVFTAEQAAYGKNVFLGACVSCHSPADYTGGAFWGNMIGTNVAKFFKYVRENMPQDNPGGLANEDYAAAVAYILQLNGMPPGAKPLPADSASLAQIQIVEPGPPPHHFSTGR